MRALNIPISSDTIGGLLKQCGLDRLVDGIDKDNISHFLLRLAFCSSYFKLNYFIFPLFLDDNLVLFGVIYNRDELRRWLQTHESILFRYRFDTQGNESESFFASNGISYDLVLVI